MDQKFTAWLVKEIKSKLAPIDVLLLIGTIIIGLALRKTIWFAAMETGSYQCTSTAMKVVGVIFDVLVACLAGLIVYQFTKSMLKGLVTYAVTFMLPVMVAGSALWGMCDSVYVFFILLSFYALKKDMEQEKNTWFILALIYLGFAIFFQQYSLFLLPVFVVYYLGKEKDGNRILGFVAPAVGLVLHKLLDQGIGSFFIMFAKEGELASTRGTQLLSYNCPNFFALIGPDAFVGQYGLAFRVVVLAILFMLIIVCAGKKVIKNADTLLTLSLLSVMMIPMFMPFMDERAFLLAAIFAVIFGFVNLKYFYVPLIQGSLTYLAYASYFRGASFLPLAAIAFVQLVLIFYLVYVYVAKKE